MNRHICVSSLGMPIKSFLYPPLKHRDFPYSVLCVCVYAHVCVCLCVDVGLDILRPPVC